MKATLKTRTFRVMYCAAFSMVLDCEIVGFLTLHNDFNDKKRKLFELKNIK